MFFKQGIYTFYKPITWTSFDVVNWVKYRAGGEKVGHAGTLDPIAEGLLIVAVGRKFTKGLEVLVNCDKEYFFEITFGSVTDTYDSTGKVIRQTADFSLTKEQLLSVTNTFIGEQDQIPPMFSAIKQQGKKLYDLARKGIEVVREPRKVNITELELLSFDGKKAELRAVVSKGTYIRSLCYDIGEKLGIGAHMSKLKRTRIGSFKLDDRALHPVDTDIKQEKVAELVQ